MARVGRVDATAAHRFGAARLQDGVAPAPAEADGADLGRAWDVAHGVDEGRYDGLADGFSVTDQPWPKGGGHDRRVLYFVHDAQCFLLLGRWFDVLEERVGERVARVQVGDVAVKARLGVFVGEETDVGESPAEDVAYEDYGLCGGSGLGLGDVGRQAADGVFAAGGGGGCDCAGETAGGHADTGCHGGGEWEG